MSKRAPARVVMRTPPSDPSRLCSSRCSSPSWSAAAALVRGARRQPSQPVAGPHRARPRSSFGAAYLAYSRRRGDRRVAAARRPPRCGARRRTAATIPARGARRGRSASRGCTSQYVHSARPARRRSLTGRDRAAHLRVRRSRSPSPAALAGHLPRARPISPRVLAPPAAPPVLAVDARSAAARASPSPISLTGTGGHALAPAGHGPRSADRSQSGQDPLAGITPTHRAAKLSSRCGLGPVAAITAVAARAVLTDAGARHRVSSSTSTASRAARWQAWGFPGGGADEARHRGAPAALGVGAVDARARAACSFWLAARRPVRLAARARRLDRRLGRPTRRARRRASYSRTGDAQPRTPATRRSGLAGRRLGTARRSPSNGTPASVNVSATAAS